MVVTVESPKLMQMLQVDPLYSKPRDQVHWQARKTYRSYIIPLDYKDLLVVQLAVGDLPLALAEKRRESLSSIRARASSWRGNEGS